MNGDVGKVIHIDWVHGSDATPAQLGADGAILEKTYAEHRHVGVGDRFVLEAPTGKKLDLTLKGTYEAPKGPPAFGTVIISQRTFDAVYPQPTNIFQLVNIRGGATDANTAKLKSALTAFFDCFLNHPFTMQVGVFLLRLPRRMALARMHEAAEAELATH